VSLFGDWLWPEPLCGIKEKHYFSPVTLRDVARTCGCGVYKRPNPHVKDLEKIKSVANSDSMPTARWNICDKTIAAKTNKVTNEALNSEQNKQSTKLHCLRLQI